MAIRLMLPQFSVAQPTPSKAEYSIPASRPRSGSACRLLPANGREGKETTLSSTTSTYWLPPARKTGKSSDASGTVPLVLVTHGPPRGAGEASDTTGTAGCWTRRSMGGRRTRRGGAWKR
jgi:hypothetical protein